MFMWGGRAGSYEEGNTERGEAQVNEASKTEKNNLHLISSNAFLTSARSEYSFTDQSVDGVRAVAVSGPVPFSQGHEGISTGLEVNKYASQGR